MIDDSFPRYYVYSRAEVPIHGSRVAMLRGSRAARRGRCERFEKLRGKEKKRKKETTKKEKKKKEDRKTRRKEKRKKIGKSGKRRVTRRRNQLSLKLRAYRTLFLYSA